MNQHAVCIGIQARSTSTRLPGKSMKIINGRPIIDHVIYACRRSLVYLNKFSHRTGINVELVVLVPEGDELEHYLNGRVDLICGPEDDLIARYRLAMKKYDPDYLIRITGDCPLIPPFLISKAVTTAIRGEYDFLSNAHPQFRTFFDGSDVEVCSKRFFYWLDEMSKEREHVFKIMYEGIYPEWKTGHIFSYVDLSAVKLSIDTEEDYQLVKKQIENMYNKRKLWEKEFGEGTANSF